MRRTNLVGMKFGRLMAIEFSHRNEKNNSNYWKCLCECGNPKVVIARTADLKRKHVSSCGCYHLEKISKTRKQNKYILYDDYIIGEIDSLFFYADIEDYDKIKDYYWSNSSGYAKTKRNKKWISMHRLVMGLDSHDYVIDHINHNKMDNRKENLRICTQRENSSNRSGSEKKEFGVFGVRLNIYGNYDAGIGYENKWIYLGSFCNLDDAISARAEKEVELFGEFSPHYKEIK